MAQDDDGVNENLAWATDTQLLDELSNRYHAFVVAGIKHPTSESGALWSRVRGCPFACVGLANMLAESTTDRMLAEVGTDDDEEEDWNRG